ncbi:hypothetical protein RJT34_16490 [Clitoria ternatea]|uniref:Uncharacterized protein n=1 Tax=Clitoria ternatea TaxID=43366 RepID=A0AAN9J7A2_CLITE
MEASVLVRGPLGIVSGTELAFLFVFIVLLVWSFAIWEKKLGTAAVEVRHSWEHMFGFPVFSNGSWLLSASTVWTHIRELHQVPSSML